LYPHEQHKKVKFVYTGAIKVDGDKQPIVNLVTFDSDYEFLDACPKVDLTERQGIETIFLSPLI
jgi:hypothetical protein